VLIVPHRRKISSVVKVVRYFDFLVVRRKIVNGRKFLQIESSIVPSVENLSKSVEFKLLWSERLEDLEFFFMIENWSALGVREKIRVDDELIRRIVLAFFLRH